LVTDGSRIYFSSCSLELTWGNRVTGCSLYQAPAAGGDTVPIETSFPNPNLVDISPDRSELLAVSICDVLNCPIWIMPVLGRSPRRLGDIRAYDASWFPDGKEVVYSQNNTLYRVKIDGTESKKIVSVATDESPFGLRWSPDGSRLRFSVSSQSSGTALWEVSADGNNLHPLLPGWNKPPAECCGSWTADGKYFLFQSQRGGTTNIWAIREEGSLLRKFSREPVQLTTGPTSTYSPLPSMDGRKLFTQTVQIQGELVRYESVSHQFVPFLSGISAFGVDFSRDGRWVTFVAYPEGTLWRSKIDGSERLQLTFPPLFVLQPRWSPDGTRIAFMAQQTGDPPPNLAEQPWRVYVIPAEGGTLEQPTPGDHSGADPNWSPDGNSLLFGGRPFDESLDLKIVDLRTHAISKVPGSDGLWSPRWSPDGRHILATPRAGERLPMMFDAKGEQWRELVKMRVGYPAWSRNGNYIYFLGLPQGSQPIGVFRIQISDHKLEQVVSLKGFRQPDSRLVWGWLGLAPDDSPLLLRDAGIRDIYALDWDAP
jgi:Tol biopolymer transport system component